MAIPYFAQAMLAHEPALVYIAAHTGNPPLAGVLPHRYVALVGQYRLFVCVLRNHQFVVVYLADKMFVVEIGESV